ncbi:hypothetical protein Lal_00007206 [Lupinus albus]|nr:hypothetical protein Lal_00007206 [Lupinus albus]
MAKKRTTTHEKKKKIISFDMIPKCSQQPRSSPQNAALISLSLLPLLIILLSSSTQGLVWLPINVAISLMIIFYRNLVSMMVRMNSDSSPGSSSDEIRSSNVIASSLKEKEIGSNTLPEGHQLGAAIPKTIDQCLHLSFLMIQLWMVIQIKVTTLPAIGLFSIFLDASNKKIDMFKMSESTPHGSPVSDSNSFAVTPGSVVWARTACQMWWPAEVFTAIFSHPSYACHLYCPEQVKSGRQYSARIEINLPPGLYANGNITCQTLKFPQSSQREGFRPLESTGSLERVIQANEENRNELLTATITLSNISRSNLKGLAFVTRRVNIIPQAQANKQKSEPRPESESESEEDLKPEESLEQDPKSESKQKPESN